MAKYTITVNGQIQEVNADPDTPMLWVLRDELNLVGTKYGCGITQCGACTIHMDDTAVRSCSLPISAVGEAKLTTIEGLSKDAKHPLQQAWREHDVPQCGYCQSGMIMAAEELLNENPDPTAEDIKSRITNICRCGTYNRIVAAVQTAAKNRQSPDDLLGGLPSIGSIQTI